MHVMRSLLCRAILPCHVMPCHAELPGHSSLTPLPYLCLQSSGDQGCASMVGVPRVQPLNDYRLLYMVHKGLETYLKANNVYAACGNDYRLYASPIIKFQKACKQVVNGYAWYLSGERCVRVMPSRRACAGAAGLSLMLPSLARVPTVSHPPLTSSPPPQCASPTPASATPPRRPTAAS